MEERHERLDEPTSIVAEYNTPSELMHIDMHASAANDAINFRVRLRGVYRCNPNKKIHNYDILRDEKTGDEILIVISDQQKQKLRNGCLVLAAGIINRPFKKGRVLRFHLRVSKIMVLKEASPTDCDAWLID